MTTSATRTPQRTCFLGDIVVTAVEGGVGYWAEHRNYDWKQDDAGNLTDASVELRSADGDDELKEWTPVTLDTIEAGIAKIKEQGFTINPSLKKLVLYCDNEDDASDVDADIADCIVQAALFGKLVYG